MNLSLPKPGLIFVIDYDRRAESRFWQQTADAALKGGCDWLIIRVTETPLDQLQGLAHDLRAMTRQRAALFSVRNDAGFAASVDADSVHYSEDRLKTGLEPYRLRGVSVHSVQSGQIAEASGADYLLAGAMFETSTHPGKSPHGVSLITALRESTRLPVYAIGGLTPQNAGQVMWAGAWGIAVISGIADSASPQHAAEQYKQTLLESRLYETALH